MFDKIEKLKNITEVLDEHKWDQHLLHLEELLENKNFYLTFMGQFSAGKSKLINKLLGKDILPVHTTETTALITFIRYAESDEERAEITNIDGTEETIPLSEVKELYQGNRRVDEIEQLTLFVNSDLLSNGLIFADTPGVNTIISKHVELSTQIIGASDRVVYVMGKHITASDQSFIQNITDCGIRLMFVRTHMDDLRSTEENVMETVRQEQTILSPFTNDKIFFVSNEEDGSEWSNNINNLRDYIQKNISNDVVNALEQTIAERVKVIAEDLSPIIYEKQTNIMRILNGEQERYDAEKSETEKKLKKMEEILNENKGKLEEKCKSKKDEIEQDIKDEAKSSKKSIALRIQDINAKNETLTVEIVDGIVKKECSKLQDDYIDSYNKILQDNSEDIRKAFEEFSDNINISSDIPQTIDESNDEIMNLQSKIDALNILKAGLTEELENLSEQNQKNDMETTDIESQRAIISDALADVDKELQELGPYIPQYITEEGTHGCENVMKKIGNILDWATIFIPGPAWAKLGGKVFQVGAKGAKTIAAASKSKTVIKTMGGIASKMNKIAKTAKKATGIGKVIKNGKQLIGVADTGVDLLRGGYKFQSMLQNKYNANHGKSNVEKKPNLLDYISLEYWFGKIGSKFDKPDTLVLDKQYESEYESKKNEIIERKRSELEHDLNVQMRLIDIKNEKQRLEAEKLLREKKQEETDKEIAKIQAEIAKTKSLQERNIIVKYYIDQSEHIVDDFVKYLINNVQPTIDDSIKKYIETYDFSIKTDISKKRVELAKLDEMFRSADREKLLADQSRLCAFASDIKSICG